MDPRRIVNRILTDSGFLVRNALALGVTKMVLAMGSKPPFSGASRLPLSRFPKIPQLWNHVRTALETGLSIRFESWPPFRFECYPLC